MTGQPSASRGGIENPGAGRQVIGKAVQHDVAFAEAGREHRACDAGEILAVAFRLEDRAWRHQQAFRLAGRGDIEAAERRCFVLQAGKSDLCSNGSFASAAREVTDLGSTPARCFAQPGAVLCARDRDQADSRRSRSRVATGRGFRGSRSDRTFPPRSNFRWIAAIARHGAHDRTQDHQRRRRDRMHLRIRPHVVKHQQYDASRDDAAQMRRAEITGMD